MKSIIVKVSCLLALIVLSCSVSFTQARTLPVDQVVSDSGDIRFVQAEDGVLVFELNLKNLPAKGSMLKIMDETGNLIYEETIKTASFSRLYKIERNNISRIVFEVSGKKILLNKTFSINSHMEERIEVAKL